MLRFVQDVFTLMIRNTSLFGNISTNEVAESHTRETLKKIISLFKGETFPK